MSHPEPYVVPPSQEFDGNDGSWSTFKISVGTPGQDFRLLPSTQSAVTYVILPDGCGLPTDPDDCANLRGADIFHADQNAGFQTNESSTWSDLGQYTVDLEAHLNYTANGMFGFDKVALGPAAEDSSLSLDGQLVAGIAELSYYMGYVPLGIVESSFSSVSDTIDSFMYQLRNASQIPSLSFAYTAGAPYRLKSVFGSLILGGYDGTRFEPNEDDFSFTFSNDPSKLLTVGVETISATNTLLGTYTLSESAHFSLIDSTVPHLWLPREICDHFQEAFGLIYDDFSDLYLVNDTIHEELTSNNPTITIKLVNSLEDSTTRFTNIKLPYAAFDLQSTDQRYFENATNYFPIRRAANDSQYTLGRTLLQEAYLIVDYERQNFTIAQAAFPDPLPAANIITIHPPPRDSTDPNSPNPNSDSGSSSLSKGAIAGISIGGIALLIFLCTLLFFCLRRRRRRRHHHHLNSHTTTTKHELPNNQINETGLPDHQPTTLSTSTLNNNNNSPQKISPAPQELAGTAISELASPLHSEKSCLTPNEVPQELPTPPNNSTNAGNNAAPRWQEVTVGDLEPGELRGMVGVGIGGRGGEGGGEGEGGRGQEGRDGGGEVRYSGLVVSPLSPNSGRFHERL